jgi:hypothetical protein
MVKPYPEDHLCVKCGKFLPDFDEKEHPERESNKVSPKEFETKRKRASDKLQGVRAKPIDDKIAFNEEKINLKGEEEYIRFCGVTSVERTPLFYTNKKLEYLLELTNNLDFIATSIMGGTLDKMLLVRESDNNLEEKCQFYEKEGIIYIIYGIFPDKKGKWILEQMAKFYGELVINKDVDNLSDIEKNEIDFKFAGRIRYIFKEYLQLKDVFTDQEIPYVDNSIKIDYLGLSSMSIGVVSLLLDDQNALNIELVENYEDPNEELEMKESSLTAKIEAIAANTLGNTGAYPRWIAVKLKFQQYRFLTFKEYPNYYFLSLLSEGNLKKIPIVEKMLDPLIYHVIGTPFEGNLKPFNQLKATLKNQFEEETICPFCKHVIKEPYPSDHLCPNCKEYIEKFENRKFY